jgi:glycosyltransferase involved in cell wall biosynthesis
VKPRVLLVARTRYELPLDETLRRRFDALSGVLDWRQLGTSATGSRVVDDRFTLVPRFPLGLLDGAAFYAALPFRVAAEIRSFRPDAVVVQGAPETALALLGRALARSRVPVVFDVHGDWHHGTRVYGSPLRRLLNPLADATGRIAVRRADGVRTVSEHTTELVLGYGVEPAATFPAYMDLEPFRLGPPAPLPGEPSALFVGVLERYKGVDVLAAAWRRVVDAVPSARLHIVGSGRLEDVVRELVAQPRLGVGWTPRLPTEGVAAALDAATLLVLPSRGEGMGRVVVEAFCRGRAVVGTDAGGIPDLVGDGENGLLVPVDDAEALGAALVRVLSDPGLAARLGQSARASASAWAATPEEFASRFRALVDAVVTAGRS